MFLLKHRSAAHSVVALDDLDTGRPEEAARVRVVPSQAADEESPRGVIVEGGSTDPINELLLDELLLAVASGDREAVAALESRIGGLVRVNIRRVLRDASRSDAVTQEFFAEVPRDVTSFDPDRDSAQAWLLTRAHLRAMSGLTSGLTASERIDLATS